MKSDDMKINQHSTTEGDIAEIQSDKILVSTPQDGLDLLGNIYYQGFGKVILHEKNLSENFFDLSTGLAGEVLQKFSNYRIRLAIVGDFSRFPGKSLRDFIRESNRGTQVNFLPHIGEAITILSK